MAKGQLRGNREKKKPKADKSEIKQATPTSIFSAGRFPGSSTKKQLAKYKR